MKWANLRISSHVVFRIKFPVLTGLLVLAAICPGSVAMDCPPEPPRTNGESGSVTSDDAVTQERIQQVRKESFPELKRVDLRTRSFHSRSDYFRTRFSLARFFLPMKMRYYIEINPALFAQQAPADGVCAILAHELSHVSSLNRGNRLRRLSLVRLLSGGYTAKFERRTDLEAIHRGYGDGLKSYRTWVYAHIPPEKLSPKRRNYFSPEEIDAIQTQLHGHPGRFVYWSKHVPLNLEQVLGSPQ